MSRSEKKFRTEVCELLAQVMAFPVENEYASLHADAEGTPDVCCTLGWLELKVAESPKRPDVHVAILTRPSQRVWHRKWRVHGGVSWTLTLLDDEIWMLHDGLWASKHLGRCDGAELGRSSLMTTVRPTTKQLISAMLISRDEMLRNRAEALRKD